MPAPASGDATRDAVLDATIDVLIAHGWAGLTTRRIAEASGVTRGAQQHHFGTKAELVGAAVLRLADRALAQLMDELAALPVGEDRIGAVLDVTWRAHTGPLYEAALELWVAGRTDHEVRDALGGVERRLLERVGGVAAAFGGGAAREGFRDDVDEVLALMRGLAMRRFVIGNDAIAERAWQRARPRCHALLAQGR